MEKKNGNGIGFRWALIVVLLLAVWTVTLAVPRPKAVFHGGPRWIGENMLAGIPVLCAFALFTAFLVHRWQTRDQRKLERLRAERLRAEQKRQTDELKRQLAAVKRQAAESRRNAKRQEAELQKQGAEHRKQEVREAIKAEERIREERLRSERLA